MVVTRRQSRRSRSQAFISPDIIDGVRRSERVQRQTQASQRARSASARSCGRNTVTTKTLRVVLTKCPDIQVVTISSDSEDDDDVICITNRTPSGSGPKNCADGAGPQRANCFISPGIIDAPSTPKKQSLPAQSQKFKRRSSVPARPGGTATSQTTTATVSSTLHQERSNILPDPRTLPELSISLTRVSPEECRIWSSQSKGSTEARIRKTLALFQYEPNPSASTDQTPAPSFAAKPEVAQIPGPGPSVAGSKSKFPDKKELDLVPCPEIAGDVTPVEKVGSTTGTGESSEKSVRRRGLPRKDLSETAKSLKKSGRGPGRPRKTVDLSTEASKQPRAIAVSQKRDASNIVSSTPPPKIRRRRSGLAAAQTPAPVVTGPRSAESESADVADPQEVGNCSSTVQDIIDRVATGADLLPSPDIAHNKLAEAQRNENTASPTPQPPTKTTPGQVQKKKVQPSISLTSKPTQNLQTATEVSRSTLEAAAVQHTNNIVIDIDITSTINPILSTPEPDRAKYPAPPSSVTPEAELHSNPTGAEVEADASFYETPSTPKRSRSRGRRVSRSRSASRRSVGRTSKGPVKTVGLIDAEENLYEIEMVVGFVVADGKDLYCIKWRGWPVSYNTWEPARNLSRCPNLVAAYFRNAPDDYQLYQEFLKTKKTVEPTPAQEPVPIFNDLDPQAPAIMVNVVGELSVSSAMPTPAIPTPTTELHDVVEDRAVTPEIENAVCTPELESVKVAGQPARSAGSPTPEAGPLTPETGPPTPEASPPTPEAGPPTPLAGPRKPQAGPLTPEADPPTTENVSVAGALELEEEGTAVPQPDENVGPPNGPVSSVCSPVFDTTFTDLPPKWKSIDGADYIFREEDYCYYPLIRTEDVKDRIFRKILTRTRCRNPDLTAYLVHLKGDPVGHCCWIAHEDVINYFHIELAVFSHKQRVKAMYARTRPTYF